MSGPNNPVRLVRWEDILGKYVDVTDIYPLPVSGASGGGGDPVVTVPGDTAAQDAFGRSRVSTQGFRVDSTFTYDEQPLLFDEITAGAGAVSHNANLRAVYLTTGGTAAVDEACLRLRGYAPYTPGNSQMIVITGTLNPDDESDWTNARAEIGYGDENNGVGFRYDENGAHIFLRSSISGSPADLVLEAWADVDNPIATDWSKSQIFIIDFQSLAVGRIRFYLDRDGIAVLVHEIHNDNIRVGPYWQLASLPPYWKIENTGVANATCRVLAICVTVKSEGAPDLSDLPGFTFTATNGATRKAVGAAFVPLVSLRLRTTFNSIVNRGIVIPVDIEILSDDEIHFVLVKNPASLTGASWNAVHAQSICEYDVAATALGAGRDVFSGYAAGGIFGGNTALAKAIEDRAVLSLSATGAVSDVLTLAAIQVGASSANVGCSINFKEIR